jgi:hypothetical protein
MLLYLGASDIGASTTPWPTLLGSREAFSPEVSAAVERLWLTPTLSRTINGPSVRAPLDLYAAFVDTPEVTAAAARFRKIQSYRVRVIDDDHYWGDDGEGARGLAHVLRREPRRRVFLSQGEDTNAFMGTISGSALTILDLDPRDGWVRPRLTAYVRIDNRSAATLARLLVPTFGFIADRKLGEGLRITSAVAEWAADRSGGFCSWFAHEPLPKVERKRIQAVLTTCRAASRSSTPAEQDSDRGDRAQSTVDGQPETVSTRLSTASSNQDGIQSERSTSSSPRRSRNKLAGG